MTIIVDLRLIVRESIYVRAESFIVKRKDLRMHALSVRVLKMRIQKGCM